MYTTLVLPGGGVKGAMLLGALDATFSDLRGLKRIVASSVGSIIGFGLVIGLSPKEMFQKGLDLFFTKQLNFGFVQDWWTSSSIQQKQHLPPTLKSLYDHTGILLVMTTFNLTTQSLVYLSADTFPDLPIDVAIKMSASMPFMFPEVEYQGEWYTDGGIHTNFPLTFAENLTPADEKILAFCFELHQFTPPNANTKGKALFQNLLTKFAHYCTIAARENDQRAYAALSVQKTLCISLTVPNDIYAFSFSVSPRCLSDLFIQGWLKTSEYVIG